MKKFLLKLLGVNLDEIQVYLMLKQREKDVLEFFRLENEIKKRIEINKAAYHNRKDKDITYIIRVYTQEGFPVAEYKKLSDKLHASDDSIYEALQKERDHVS